MKLLYYFLSILVLGSVSKAWAQDGYFNCGHDQHMHQMWAEHPELKEDYKQLFENAKHVVNDGLQAKTIYTIPVVFHILHMGGAENISDAQVFDQMEVLNRDYMLQNADIANAVAGFDTVAGKAEIQFKLAAIDPWGNCTNGINHIYSHETKTGDNFSKINLWPRAHYLNVWVVKAISSGAAGYSQYPTSVDGANFYTDGVMILNGYIGRIGTGEEFRSRALTHEIGHYLGLPHVWGDTNEPGVACGDDGVEDTPITKGFNFCPSSPAQAMICVDTIVENYQNYMDYSYCSIMFTKGQVNLMRNFLQGPSGARDILVSDSTAELTGINLPTVPLCAPVADFLVNKGEGTVCAGKTVTLTDLSWNGVVSDRVWEVQDGTISNANSANPTVQFNSPGWKRITLTVSNDAGSDSKSIEKAVYVYPDWPEVSAPNNISFENDNKYLVRAYNPEPETPGFMIDWHVGNNSSTSYVLKYYKEFDNVIPFSNDYFYKKRRGEAEDYLYLPSYSIKYVSGATITFDYAYATDAFLESDITEELIVETSTNCGQSWTPRKTLKKVDLLTGGNASDKDFKPTSTQWKTTSVSLPGGQTRYLVRLKFVSSDFSNNLYIDNIRLEGTLFTEDPEFAALDVNVYPNPTNATEGIYVAFNANDKDVEIALTDMSGKILSSEVVTAKNTAVTHKVNSTSELRAGIYFVRISQGENQMTKKIVIL